MDYYRNLDLISPRPKPLVLNLILIREKERNLRTILNSCLTGSTVSIKEGDGGREKRMTPWENI